MIEMYKIITNKQNSDITLKFNIIPAAIRAVVAMLIVNETSDNLYGSVTVKLNLPTLWSGGECWTFTPRALRS